MADKKKMSVADILAAARKGTAGSESQPSPASGDAAPPASKASEPAASESAPAEKAAVAPNPKPAATGGKMSVADILAAARAKKSGDEPAAPQPVAKPTAAEKPAAKPKVDRPAAAAASTSAVRDTSSILAAARGAAKPGPITKSEAAAKLNPAAPAKAKEKEAVVLPPMPTKPEYAKAKPAKEPVGGEERRFFLGVMFGSFLGAGFTSLAAVSGLWTLAFARFMFPNVLTEPPSKFKIGFPGDFAPGAVDEKFKAQFGIWPVSTEYKGLRQMVALKTVCTHLGCTPNWLEAEQKFKCPCHGSGFYKDGINFEGPAPRPLERYAIRLADDGQLEVDKSRTFQEELGQWSDPACFVPV